MGAQSGNGSGRKAKRSKGRATVSTPRLVMPALAALGIGGIGGIAGPAAALELGPVRVDSLLGEPLRASIAFALRPEEQIAAHCVRVARGPSASGLPSPGPTWVSVRDGMIHLVGERPLADPLVGLQVMIDCPYTPRLAREYTVLLDPPRTVEAEPRVAAAVPAAAVREPEVAPAEPRPRRSATAAPAIPPAATYRVRPGDSLSGIAARLENRRVGLWAAVERLFDENPQAFIDGDLNRLRAGALLRIPADVVALPTDEVAPVAARAPLASASAAAAADASPAPRVAAPAAAAADSAPAAGTARAGGESVAEAPAAAEARPAAAEAAPRPGDILVDPAGLFVTPIEDEVPPAERAIAMPEVSGADGLVVPAGDAGAGRSWLFWLAGGGIALLAGLGLFGRRLRERFTGGRHLVFNLPGEDVAEDVPDADAEHDPAQLEVDFRFDDDATEARIVRVDADLDDGSGFQEGGDIDVAQDFGFADSGNLELGLDLDLAEEPAVAPHRTGEVIVEQEIPPGSTTTSEYDLSMIVDATRQPLDDDDDTEKDLRAVEVGEAVGETEDDPFTLSHAVDYKILEQDYEDELTATQALARELSEAARDLIGEPPAAGGESLHELPTVEMPKPGEEDTAKMPQAPAEGDTVEMIPASEIAEPGDTDVNETVVDAHEAGNDPSATLEVEAATVDTKKLKVS